MGWCLRSRPRAPGGGSARPARRGPGPGRGAGGEDRGDREGAGLPGARGTRARGSQWFRGRGPGMPGVPDRVAEHRDHRRVAGFVFQRAGRDPEPGGGGHLRPGGDGVRAGDGEVRLRPHRRGEAPGGRGQPRDPQRRRVPRRRSHRGHTLEGAPHHRRGGTLSAGRRKGDAQLWQPRRQRDPVAHRDQPGYRPCRPRPASPRREGRRETAPHRPGAGARERERVQRVVAGIG